MEEDKIMARYLVLWEIDTTKTPEDPKAKKAQYLAFGDLVKKQLQEGAVKEWGLFLGSAEGYNIFEGSNVELQTLIGMWTPFIRFNTRELMTIDEVIKANKALPG
jgi:hypothetical protein